MEEHTGPSSEHRKVCGQSNQVEQASASRCLQCLARPKQVGHPGRHSRGPKQHPRTQAGWGGEVGVASLVRPLEVRPAVLGVACTAALELPLGGPDGGKALPEEAALELVVTEVQTATCEEAGTVGVASETAVEERLLECFIRRCLEGDDDDEDFLVFLCFFFAVVPESSV